MLLYWVSAAAVGLAGLLLLLGFATKYLTPIQRLSEQGIINLAGGYTSAGITWLLDICKQGVALLWGQRQETLSAVIADETFINRLIDRVYYGLWILVVISFVGSFLASRAFAEEHGITPYIAWAIPISVDGITVLCMIALVIRAAMGQSYPLARIGMVVSLMVSVIFNVWELGSKQDALLWVHILLGIVFPGVVWFGTELITDLTKEKVIRSGAIKTLDQVRQETERLEGVKVSLEEEIQRLKQVKKQGISKTRKVSDVQPVIHQNGSNGATALSTADRREQVAALLAQGKTQQAIADELHVSLATVKRDIKAVTG